MRLVRTFPRDVPANRNYIIDGLERVVTPKYDARALVGLGDVLVLEWDIAVSKEDLAHFADVAAANRDRVLVAPYRLYPEANPGLSEAIWAPRRMPGNIPVELGEPVCHYFGFGMTYLPGKLLQAFADEWLTANPYGNLTDETFSRWHYLNCDPDVPVCWGVRPVHLHYRPDGLPGPG